MRKKLTLFISMLFLSLGIAWAQTATLEVSTNVAYPEYQYRIKSANNFWMASNTAPTQNNIASFAFFAAGNDFYKIYSIDKGQWVSYDKSNGSDNCKDFVKFANSQDAANLWKITQVTRNTGKVYQIQPQNNDGTVSNRYMNWNAGVGDGGGFGYTYDDTKTVGLWRDNGSNDGGSAWILVDNTESVTNVTDFENGAIYTFVTARGWMGANTTTNVISSAYSYNGIPAADVKRTNPNFQWTVYKSENGKYYLYNIGKGQFMGMQTVSDKPIPFAETPAGLKMTFKQSGNTNYPIMFSIDNVGVVNHSKDIPYGLIYWTGGWNNPNDEGSNHKVVKVGELDDATLSNISARVAQYENTAILKMPEAGKYYRIMAVEGWNDDARYLGSNNSTTYNSRAAYVANADAYTIFYFDGNYLKSYATGNYLVSNSNFLGYNGMQATGSKIGFQEDQYVSGVYNISFNDGSRWLYVSTNDYTDAGSSAGDVNGYRFNIEEVTKLPVAQSGNTVYYTLDEAKDNVKAGETLTLFVDTEEEIELPLGVILEKNGHTADKVTVATPVAEVGGVEYATLAAAVKAASAGSTITFIADVNENVTLDKNVTIDGAGKQYIGTMTVNKGLTVTVENVNFVNGGIDKPKAQKSSTGTYTIKNCTFVDEGKYNYPLRFYGAATINVESCSVKNYLYSFLYINGSTLNLNINNVTVEDCPNYAVYFATGVTNATIEGLTVKNSNNGILVNNTAARTLTIKDCKMEKVTTAINHAGDGTYAITANVQGANDFGGAALSQYAKCVLAEDATLAATTADLNITTNVEGKEVAYQDGKYTVVVKRDPAGHVAYRADVTDKTDREGIAILLKEVYAKKSLVVKVYNGETLMFTCTRRDIDDEDKVMFPVDGNTTANIVLSGKKSGSWINKIDVAPTELNVPNRVEIWADDVLVQNYTHESGTILGTNLEKYLALDCVEKFDAKIGNAGYKTLAAAVEAANAGETIGLLRDVTASDIITINKAIALDGNGKKLTSTAGRAINIETEGKVVINNLTVKAAERAFNIINKAATVELNDVTATASNNAVMIATSAGAANVTINGCDFTGLAVVNVAGANAQVAINDTKITNIDANEAENYGAITVYSTATNAKVTVNGGSITVADDSKKAYIFAEGATVTGVDQIGQIVAMIGEAGYETLTEAIADAKEGQTVKMVYDVTGAGVVIDKSITIDFNGKTYTVNQTVGSTGTTTLGLQILKDNTVTLKNGTLTSTAAVEGSKEVKMLVQNYANLTVDNMKLVDATDHILYVLSNNSGTVNVVNGSEITANGAVALDACKYANYVAPTVNVAEGVTVKGNVEVSATLNMNGTLDGTIVINGAEGTVNGAEGLNVTAMEDYKVAYADGAYTVVKKHYVAQVGEQKHETFAAAVAAASAGATITLIDDATEDATVVLTKSLTIDGAGKTFTGAIEFKTSRGSFTVKNVKFNGAGNRVYALKSQAEVTRLTVENCEATGYTYGFLYANKVVTNAIVNDVFVKDVNYGVHSAYGTNVTLNNFVAENVKYGVMVQNYGTRNVVLNNCSFTGCENPLYIWERNQTNKITFNFEGANEMGKADYCTSTMAVVNADAVVGTKVCGTLAEAVEAAQAGETVTLLRNAELSTFLTINKSITLNMGEYNITRDGGTALYVNGDVEVEINGTTGTVTGSQALWVAKGLAKVNGGNFCGGAEAVYVTNTGKAEIYGGTFSSSKYDSFVLNKKDDSRETTSITVYGGTFVGFNPANNAAEGQGTNFVAAGLMAVDNGDDTYGIAKANVKMGDSYYATLAEAIAAVGSGDVVIELLADATLDYDAREAYGTAETATVTIAGNGKTLTLNQTNSDWSSFGLAAGKVAFNNMTIEKTGHGDTNGAWNKHAIIFSSPVEMNDVTVNNSVAVQAGATLNNVTINEAGEYYGLWINGNGQNVTINGGAINATNAGRGIKIADQYIDAPAQVTLNVTGTAFSTAKKAAVLVSSEAGAKITASNVNIENVVADQVNFVWVDEDWAQHFANVQVEGATVAQEGIEGFVAQLPNGASYKTLAAAITAATSGQTITLIGDVKESVTIGKNINIDGKDRTITGTITLQGSNIVSTVKNVNFDGDNKALYYAFSVRNTKNLTIEDCTVKNYFSGLFYAPKSSSNVTVKNVTVEDCGEYLAYMVSLNSATFENVTLKDSESGIIVTNSGPKTVTLKNCTMTDVDMPIEIKEKATANITFIFEGVNEMGKADFYTSEYVKIVAGAQGGSVVCENLSDAVANAETGETVTLLSDFTLDTKGQMAQCDGYHTFVCVEGKAITIDLNGKNITVDATDADLADAKGKMLLGVFSTDNGGKLTLVDSKGTATVTLNANDAKVYSLLCNYEGGCQIKVEGGTYVADKVSDSMLYSGADAGENEGVIVNGGNFTLGNVGEGANGKPWIFNALGANERNVVVNGGTFNADVNHQFWALEVEVPANKALKDNGNATWTVVDAVASVAERYKDNQRTIGYATLAEAVASTYGNEITLLTDATGAGVVINKDVTIDFAGKTYTVNKAVGSKGTETLGMQILKDNNVTLKNGTLTSATPVAEGKEVKMLINNYANLTLENMNLVDATDHILYALSNNSGETVLTGNTNITTDAVAFDAYKSNSYAAPTVIVETTGKITGAIEKNDGATIAISGGTFTVEILPEWCAEYYAPVKNDDGTYGVVYTYVDELTIVDSQVKDFVNEIDKTVGKLTYERRFAAGIWNPLYVPFEIPMEKLVDNYDVVFLNDVHTNFDDNGNETTMYMEHVTIKSGTLHANYPYLIRPKTSNDVDLTLELEDVKLYKAIENTIECSSVLTTFTIGGTYHNITGDEIVDKYSLKASGNWGTNNASNSLKAFRLYLTITRKDGSHFIPDPSMIRIYVRGEEDVTGIDGTEFDANAADQIFDLQGRRVTTPVKGGVYIVNGKKVYINK